MDFSGLRDVKRPFKRSGFRMADAAGGDGCHRLES
jgi:hypothetical protein